MAKRRRLHEISLQEDIRYRGPLSFQWFQAFGWLCIALTAVIMLLKISDRIDPASAGQNANLLLALNLISAMSLPFLLIANFARILNNNEGYKKQLIRNGGAALAIFVISVLFFLRYVSGMIGEFVTDPEEVIPVLTESFRGIVSTGFIAFNLFVDLFLCTLVMFFLNARPGRFFTGKKLHIFRLLAVLPIAYEIFSLILKYLSVRGRITLPLWTFPLLTVKPPVTFAVFVILAVFIKTRELRFRRHGRTHEEYQAFLKTNRNSLHFSVFLSITLVAAGIVDFLIFTLLTAKVAGNASEAEITEHFLDYASVASGIGFGEAIPLLFVAPIILLFSYTRVPRNKMISMLIPLGAIILMILILLEGVYRGVGFFAQQGEKLSIQQLADMIRTSMAAP